MAVLRRPKCTLSELAAGSLCLLCIKFISSTVMSCMIKLEPRQAQRPSEKFYGLPRSTHYLCAVALHSSALPSYVCLHSEEPLRTCGLVVCVRPSCNTLVYMRPRKAQCMPMFTSKCLIPFSYTFLVETFGRISISIIVSFLARALSTIPGNLFCYSAISSAGVVLILPGFTIRMEALSLSFCLSFRTLQQ